MFRNSSLKLVVTLILLMGGKVFAQVEPNDDANSKSTYLNLSVGVYDDEKMPHLPANIELDGTFRKHTSVQWNPDTQIVGSCHGQFDTDGRLKDGGDDALLAELNALSPDFIWVGLGTPKQQAWIHRHKHRLNRGVLLGVGFGFDVNAGTKRDAPEWMQRRGLTWLFRLATEPRRLAGRYFKYNSLFMLFLLWDALRGKSGKTQCL